LERAVGKLVAAVQKEWHEEAGEDRAAISEQVMDRCHDLLKAAKQGSLQATLGTSSLAEFLGSEWLREHPRVQSFVEDLKTAVTPREF
jgi:hypothetical protein